MNLKKRFDFRFVYFMFNPDTGKTKIGVTKNLRRRLEDVDDDLPGKVRYIYKKRFLLARRCESHLHNVTRIFSSPERRGTSGFSEWFFLPFFVRWSVICYAEIVRLFGWVKLGLLIGFFGLFFYWFGKVML